MSYRRVSSRSRLPGSPYIEIILHGPTNIVSKRMTTFLWTIHFCGGDVYKKIERPHFGIYSDVGDLRGARPNEVQIASNFTYKVGLSFQGVSAGISYKPSKYLLKCEHLGPRCKIYQVKNSNKDLTLEGEVDAIFEKVTRNLLVVEAQSFFRRPWRRDRTSRIAWCVFS